LTTTLFSAPFFWALLLRRSPKNPIGQLWRNRENRSAILALEALRVCFGIALFGALASQFIAVNVAAALTGALMIVLLAGFARYLGAIHSWFERRFLYNLAERENFKDSSTSPLLPWDAHLARFEVPATAEVVGKTLEEIKVRERFGVSVTLIERGTRVMTAPGRDARLFPGDRVSIIGTDEQIQAFAEVLKHREVPEEDLASEDYSLAPVKIHSGMPYCGRSIRESGLREQTDGLVVGLERDGHRTLNPDSATRIQDGDLLWIVGDRRKLKVFGVSDQSRAASP
jgi:CPA2 family monovalent cation:H+ antiporter-2